MSEARGPGRRPAKPAWFQSLAQYERPDVWLALRQVGTTTVPLLGLLVVMLVIVQRGYHYGITLALAVIATGLLMRSFIFLHDCSHGSFFASPRANTILGFVIGVLTLTPFAQWRWSHLQHHATFANLDRRGAGDVWLMTVEEYRAASRRQRLIYRVYRHPLFMFGLGSSLLFGLLYRFPVSHSPSRTRGSVWLTDLALLALMTAAGFTVGLKAFFLVMGPVWFLAFTLGVWLFYVQHQFEGVYWARQAEWDYLRASMEGASYYRLPRLLQWVTGNIGLHHLHHLRSRIPNYFLQRAYDATPAVQAVTPLTLLASLRCLRLNIYDERRKQLVSFHDID